MKLPQRDFSKMTETNMVSVDTSNWIAVLPLGAFEQHGQHLPFDTDTQIASGIAKRVSQTLDENIPATFLPVEPIGYSIEHMDFEGSQTLDYEEAIDKWIGIGESLAKLGFKKMLLLNAHGGNSPLMTIVATELRVRFNMLCVATSWTRFIEAGDIISHEEKAYGIHGGDIETSVMLALAPSEVDMRYAKKFSNFQEELAQNHKHLRAYGPHAFGWKAQDLNVAGVNGNAKEATAVKGEALLDQAVNGLCELLEEIDRFDATRFQ